MEMTVEAYLDQIIEQALEEHKIFRLVPDFYAELKAAAKFKIDKYLDENPPKENIDQELADRLAVIAQKAIRDWASASDHALEKRAIRATGIPDFMSLCSYYESEMRQLQSDRYFFTSDFLGDHDKRAQDVCLLFYNMAFNKDHYESLKKRAVVIMAQWPAGEKISKRQERQILTLLPNIAELTDLYITCYEIKDEALISLLKSEVNRFSRAFGERPVILAENKKLILDSLDYLYASWQIEQDIANKFRECGFEPPSASISLEGLVKLRLAQAGGELFERIRLNAKAKEKHAEDAKNLQNILKIKP